MQREIKFRGKRVDNGEWVYGKLLESNFNKHIITMVNTINGEKICSIMAYVVIPETVGQYTGLKDKNGKEVYIGDIVRCLEVSNTRTDEYISEIFEEECEVLVHDSRTSDTPLVIFFPHPNQIPLTEIEVLGNIYENPELLQEVEK